MKRRQHTVRREWEMISLIDIIFLLLIFAFVIPQGGGGEQPSGIPSKALTIRLKPVEQIGELHKQEVVLDAGYRSETYQDAFTIDDPFWQLSEVQFANLAPSQLITHTIDDYRKYRDSTNGLESIRVEAADDTPFKVIDFIVRRCSSFGDSALVFVPRPSSEVN